MDQSPDAQPLDPAIQLDRDLHDEAMEALREMLPPPHPDTLEARARRHRAAIVRVAALVPASSVETDLAAHHVAAMAHARDCLRQAAQQMDDLRLAMKLRAQAASMGREARGYLGKLFALQAVRKKREATDADRESAAWTEHSVLNQLTDALERLPPQPPVAAPPPQSAPPAAAEPPPQAPPPQPARPRDYEEWSDEEKHRDRIRRQADRYAILHTMRVKRIRQLGGLPPDCDYEPPEPEVLHAIITGTGSNLRWADTYEPWVPPT